MTDVALEPTGARPALLEITGLRKRYGAVEALRGVGLRLEGGRIGLLGPNGAGKSTLLKSLLGLVHPDAGTIRVLGRDAGDGLGLRARIGYMPENDCVFPGDTAVEATALAAQLCGLPPREAMARAHEVLYYVGLEEARYRPVNDFSTGMRQRVKLAQALVHDPDFLLLDEPTDGLDPDGREQMLDLIVEAWERRGAGGGDRPMHVMLSTHLLPDVERTCDQVVLVDHGAIRWSGRLMELMGADPRALAVRVKVREAEFAALLRDRGCEVDVQTSGELRVRLPEAATVDLVWDTAIAGGFQVRHLLPHRETLEDAFVRLVQGGDGAGRVPSGDAFGPGSGAPSSAAEPARSMTRRARVPRGNE